MDESTEKRIYRAIADAIHAGPSSDSQEIAVSVIGNHAELVTAWALEMLAGRAALQLRRLQPRAPDPYQMFLEGFNGLSDLMPAEGRRIKLASATIPDLLRGLKTARRKSTEKTQHIRDLIEAMRPYARTRRGLTVERYCELRAADVQTKAKKAGTKKKTGG